MYITKMYLLSLSLRSWRIQLILSAYVLYFCCHFYFLGRTILFFPCYFSTKISPTQHRLRGPSAVWYTGKSMWLESETQALSFGSCVTMAKSLISFKTEIILVTPTLCIAQVNGKGNTETVVCKCGLYTVKDGYCCYNQWKNNVS